MPELAHRIEPVYADALRAVIDEPDDEAVTVPALQALEAAGCFFLPFGRETRSNSRARCRACGNVIPEGADAISFGYDATKGHGAVSHAFIHANLCPPEGAQEKGGTV